MKAANISSRRILFQALAVLVVALVIVFIMSGIKEKYVDYMPAPANGISCGAGNKVTETSKDLFFLEGNVCDPKCCPSELTCSKGCVCLTEEQKRMMLLRGFNRSTSADSTI